jgi:hypothetical protein
MAAENGLEGVVPETVETIPQRSPAVPVDEIDVPSWWAFVRPVVWDAGLPTAAYYATRQIGGSAFVSLLAGTAVAGLRVGYVAVRAHRLDAVAGFLLAIFGIGLALSFMTGSARFLLAKDSIPTAVAGLIFLGTCVAGRPLSYAWGMRMMARTPQKQHRWASMWRTEPAFRRVFYVVSLTWGCSLLLEAAIRLPLVYVLPIDAMAGLSSVISVVAVAVLAAWTVWYARRVQR